MDEYACRRRIGLLASLSEMPAGLSQWVRRAEDALTVPVLPTDPLGPAIDTIFDWGHRIGLLVTVVSDGREAMRLAWLGAKLPDADGPARERELSLTAASPVGVALRLLSLDGSSMVQVGDRDLALQPAFASSSISDEEVASSLVELVSPLAHGK